MFHGNGEQSPAPMTGSPFFNPVERVISRPLASARPVGTTTPVHPTVVGEYGRITG
jgi:hypothetical protein